MCADEQTVMTPGVARAAVVVGMVAMLVVPAVRHRSAHGPGDATTARDRVDRALLGLTSIGFVLPLLWAVTPLWHLGAYPLHGVPFGVGLTCMAGALLLYDRAHADLGQAWSMTPTVRAHQRLVTAGVYGTVRHPMYAATLLYAVGLALVLPNWVAGPAYLLSFAPLAARRIGVEEQMLREAFGPMYRDYAAKTKRVIPGIW